MGEKGAWYLGFGVADSAPIVRPWNDPSKDTISCFAPLESRDRPTFRANLIAASFASVPLLQTNTRDADDMPPLANVVSINRFDSSPVHAL
jgi:hypothetical protein